MLQSRLLSDSVQLAADSQVLIVNSAADPFIPLALQQTTHITLAEDNIATLPALQSYHLRHIPFHEYTVSSPEATMDVAIMDILYQPSKAWMEYGLEVAYYALKVGGKLYVVGAKDRGVLSLAKRMRERFGNLETVTIGKGHRVICSRKTNQPVSIQNAFPRLSSVFASGEMDEGTRLLIEALDVRVTDVALDLGCGGGFIGLSIARLATKGHVTLVDASLAAVVAARLKVQESGLEHISVLASDGTRALAAQRFDLIATNPPFHVGGIQTTEIAERFIREAAGALRPRGRFYLVANRFLRYEPTMRSCFNTVTEVGGNTRYKVLQGTNEREQIM